MASLSLGSIQAATVSAVDWGGDYVAATQPLNDDTPANRTGSDNYGDPDGPFTINTVDSIAGRALSTNSPLSPPAGYAGTSGTFYGGGSVTRANSLANDGFSELTVLNQGSNDSLHWHVDTGGDSHTFHLLVYWDKADFLNGLSTTANLGLSEGGFSLSTSQSSGHQTDELLRWVVRDGSQFYVSQNTTTLLNNSTFNVAYSTLTNWAALNPVDPLGAPTSSDLLSLDFNEAGPYAPHTFTDVTGLGFYVEHEAATGPIHVHIEGFGADLIPEPSSALLLFSGALLTAMRRRRG